MLGEAVDEFLVVGLLDYAAGDVYALDPCSRDDGGRDVGPFLLAEVAVDFVEARDGEEL